MSVEHEDAQAPATHDAYGAQVRPLCGAPLKLVQLPIELHCWHGPSHEDAQHTPSTQWPLVQSPGADAEHAAPSARGTSRDTSRIAALLNPPVTRAPFGSGTTRSSSGAPLGWLPIGRNEGNPSTHVRAIPSAMINTDPPLNGVTLGTAAGTVGSGGPATHVPVAGS